MSGEMAALIHASLVFDDYVSFGKYSYLHILYSLILRDQKFQISYQNCPFNFHDVSILLKP